MNKRSLETRSHLIMQRCPRFIRCSVPICPLDLMQDQRTRLLGEPMCTLAKSVRRRICKDTALERHGLTKREFAARKRSESLTEAQKRSRNANLRPLSRFIHGSQTQIQSRGVQSAVECHEKDTQSYTTLMR